jgi:hypothetical protein
MAHQRQISKNSLFFDAHSKFVVLGSRRAPTPVHGVEILVSVSAPTMRRSNME